MIELAEFCRLMRGLREALEQGEASAFGRLGAALRSSVKGLSALDAELRGQISALQLRQAGPG